MAPKFKYLIGLALLAALTLQSASSLARKFIPNERFQPTPSANSTVQDNKNSCEIPKLTSRQALFGVSPMLRSLARVPTSLSNEIQFHTQLWRARSSSLAPLVDHSYNPARVTPVQRGACGTQCYFGMAFALTGLLEARQELLGIHDESNRAFDLSEQMLLDCFQGKDPTDLKRGLARESDYANEANVCSPNKARCDNYKGQLMMPKLFSNMVNSSIYHKQISEYDLVSYFNLHGPIMVLTHSSLLADWKRGINSVNCKRARKLNANPDHAVLLVGYGFNSTAGLDYLKFKNSFGSGWGDDGFGLVSRDHSNQGCSLFSAMIDLITMPYEPDNE